MSGWPYYLQTVTVMDVLESGACIAGVREWVEQNKVIAGPTSDFREQKEIQIAAFADGYDYSYRNGYSDDDCGYSDSYGYGYGYSDGYSYSDDDCGYSDSYGYGYGYSDGDGDGDSYGYSDGDGD